jgi:hypothetical protein
VVSYTYLRILYIPYKTIGASKVTMNIKSPRGFEIIKYDLSEATRPATKKIHRTGMVRITQMIARSPLSNNQS